MDLSFINSLTAERFDSIESVFTRIATYANLIKANVFDMGDDKTFPIYHYIAIATCNIGPGKFDDVAIFRTTLHHEDNNFSVEMVANHIIKSNSGYGRIEDVYYELDADSGYLMRVEADACSGCLIINSIFTHDGDILPASRGNALFVYNQIFGE